MRRLWISIAITFVTFAIGVSANALVEYFVTDELVNTIESYGDHASAVMLWQEPKLVPPTVNSCGHFVLTVGDDRRLYLNSRPMGSLDDPELLIGELENAFHVRTEFHVYRRGMEDAYDVPEEDRIDKTVYLKAGRNLSYGDIHDLIERIREVGANPVGLVRDPEYPLTEE
jgi:biopolymer transport protein ExbD